MARTRRSAKDVQWRSRLQRFQASGLSVTRFCELEQVSMPSFYQWRKRLGVPTAGESPPTFVPVRLTQMAEVEIHLPNGARICVPAGNADSLRIAIDAAGRCHPSEEPEVLTC